LVIGRSGSAAGGTSDAARSGRTWLKPSARTQIDAPSNGPYRPGTERLGGFSIVDVAFREEALAWAAKIAVACRCAQDVRELMPDPDV